MKRYIKAAVTNILDESSGIRYNLAKDPNTRPAVLAVLADDHERDIRAYVAKNPNTPAEALAKLYQDVTVRYDLSCNPNLPVSIAKKLAADDVPIQEHIARRTDMPAEVLAVVAKNIPQSQDAERLTYALCSNPNTPRNSIVELISNDLLSRFARGGAASGCADQDILRKVFELDNTYYIISRLLDNPNTPEDVLEKIHESGKYAYHHSLSINDIMKFADSPDPNIRYKIVNNPKTPQDIVVKLANDPDIDVKLAAIKNPLMPKDLLTKLAKHRRVGVRKAVAQNHNTPIDTLIQLGRDDPSAQVRREANYTLSYQGINLASLSRR